MNATPWNAYDQATADAKLGIKALQNLSASVNCFERMLANDVAQDRLLLSSLFSSAVVRYAKPFGNQSDGKGNRAYKTKWLKTQTGFSDAVHKHLIDIRNTLVAHDDISIIEPRLMTMTLNVGGSPAMTSAGVSNKSLAYPVDHSVVTLILAHARACVAGVHQQLDSDLARVRDEFLKDPVAANSKARFWESGTDISLSGDNKALLPDLGAFSWFTPETPDFSEMHNGFMYEEFRHTKHFLGPHRVQQPDGTYIDIVLAPPPAKDADGQAWVTSGSTPSDHQPPA